MCRFRSRHVGKPPAPYPAKSIHPEPLLPWDSVAPVNLRVAGQTGAHIVAMVLLLAVQRQVSRQQRARSHQRHLSDKNIEQLRQLIKGGFPQESAVSVQSLPVREKRPRCVAPIGHGAEFYQAKNALPSSGTRLGKERISPHRHSARHRQQQKKRRQNQQRRQRQEKIQQPFPEPCVHMHRIRSSSARSRSPDPARRGSSCCRSAGTARDGRGRSRHRQHRRICMRWLSRGHCPRA